MTVDFGAFRCQTIVLSILYRIFTMSQMFLTIPLRFRWETLPCCPSPSQISAHSNFRVLTVGALMDLQNEVNYILKGANLEIQAWVLETDEELWSPSLSVLPGVGENESRNVVHCTFLLLTGLVFTSNI